MSKKDNDNEDDIHYISDDSDDMNETDKIISYRSKVFKNEKDAVRIFLSDHFRKFRWDFFEKVKMTHKSVFQAIKREIRNCLNPYRIFIKDKNKENEKELKNLYEELKRYYKEKNFNNTFFINYFKDLKQAHLKKDKSKFINMLPKNEEEALNDIHRKVMLIKSLKKYLTGTLVDRLQNVNLDKNHEIGNKDEFIMKYKYLVIKKEILSTLNEQDLIKYISNQQCSLKLRRPLNDFTDYNYIPILCKGHCKQEADVYIQNFEKELYQNHRKCKECKHLINNFDNIKSQIRSLYIKTCVFSHNINEIMFHPLFLFSFENMPFYISALKNEKTNPLIEILIEIWTIPDKYFGIQKYNIRKIYNENENSMKEIIKLLKEYSTKSNLFGGSCFLPDYKIKKCPLDLLKPNKEDLNNHLIKCPYYHSNLEKRRIIKINKNSICPNAIRNKEWIKDPEKIQCEKGDNCDKFHTRNELFYDERNFRKLYPCTEYSKKNNKDKYINNFCKKFDMCPKKHPVDIKIEEIYLPSDYKSDLNRELKSLKEKEKNIRKKIEKLKKIECLLCLNYIDGEKGRELTYFKHCNHIICSSCYEICELCPFCDLKSDKQKITIKLEVNDEYSEEDEYSDNEEEEEDNEVQDPQDQLFIVNDSNLNEVNYNSDNDNENNEIENDSENNEIENNDRNENDDNDELHLSSSYSNSDSRELNIRRNQRGNSRERGRGRGRGRGERGRRVIRSRGIRGRGYY